MQWLQAGRPFLTVTPSGLGWGVDGGGAGLGSGRAVLGDNSPSPHLLQMQEKAKEIYVTFLSSKASSQVNVEGQSRLNEKILEEPHPLMFQKLQDQV